MGEAQIPISHNNADSFQQALVCSFGGILRKLPHSAVKSIEPITEIRTLPFVQMPLEGVMIGQDTSVLPIFDFSNYLSGSNIAGDYALNIETSKGAIRLRANGIPSLNASTFPGHEDIPFAIDEIEEMIKAFSNAKSNTSISNQETNNKTFPTRPLLIVRVKETHVAFDATSVDFMERHLQSISVTQSPEQRIITLQNGELIQGHSLGAMLNIKDAEPASEQWSVGFTRSNTRIAITVSQVIGFENIPLNLFNKLDQGEEVSIWINHPKYGPIKTFNSELLDQQKSNAINLQIWNGIQNLWYSKEEKIEIAILQKAVGLGIKFDKFNLVLPQELIKSVQDKVNINNLHTEPTDDSYKSYDLMKLTEGSTQNAVANQSRRAISIKHDEKNIAFLASEIYEPPKEIAWHPVPCLPQNLSKFIQAIRVQDEWCELLLKTDLLSTELKSALEPLAEQTFCGWISHTQFH